MPAYVENIQRKEENCLKKKKPPSNPNTQAEPLCTQYNR